MKTPLTDAHVKTTNPIHYVTTEFARELEIRATVWEARYNEQTKLAASYFTNPVDKECLCEWPDKTLRKVMVTSVDRGMAHIIWNERHEPIDGQGCVVGMEDTVPVAWLHISGLTSLVTYPCSLLA